MGELTYNCASLPEGTASATQRGVDLHPRSLHAPQCPIMKVK